MLQAIKQIRFSWPAISLCVIYIYIGVHLLGSNEGIFGWIESRDNIESLRQDLHSKQVQSETLKDYADQLRSNQLNPDLLDELARRQLGVSHPNEFVIWLDEPQ